MYELAFIDNRITKKFSEVDLPAYVVKDEETWSKIPKALEKKLIENIFNGIKFAIESDFLEIPLYQILILTTGKSFTSIIRRDNFDTALEYCMNYYSKNDEFEKCEIALKLINNEYT